MPDGIRADREAQDQTQPRRKRLEDYSAHTRAPFFEMPGVEASYETDLAIFIGNVDDSEWDDDDWIPNSAIIGYSEVHEEGDSGTLVITKQCARWKGFLKD